jgi:hypothetical protein
MQSCWISSARSTSAIITTSKAGSSCWKVTRPPRWRTSVFARDAAERGCYSVAVNFYRSMEAYALIALEDEPSAIAILEELSYASNTAALPGRTEGTDRAWHRPGVHAAKTSRSIGHGCSKASRRQKSTR